MWLLSSCFSARADSRRLRGVFFAVLAEKMVNFRQPPLLAIVCLLLPSIPFLPLASNGECSGPQLNEIVDILENVKWTVLARQLNVDRINSIHGACQNDIDPEPCKLNEVVKRFTNSQRALPCCEIIDKIASALETLPEPQEKEASELRKMCTSTESGIPDVPSSKPSDKHNQPTHSTVIGASQMPEEEDQSVISHQENWPSWALTIIVGLFFIYLVYGKLTEHRIGSSDQIKLDDDNGAYPWEVWHKAGQHLVRAHASKFVIAIVDSGIKKNHISFKSTSRTRHKILPQSKDFTDDNNIVDRNGHGTACASIAAGFSGITGKPHDGGVASEASLLICKVTKSKKYEVRKVIEALRYIKRLHEEEEVTTHVVSMSFGFKTDNTELRRCINELTDAGIVCVAAAGNEGSTPGTKVPFPARYPNVISIGAHNMLWTLAKLDADPKNNDDINYTTFGEAVRASAIRDNVAFNTFSGTSMAAPVAAGLIACVLERDFGPEQTSNKLDQVKHSLHAMTKPGEDLKSLRPFQVFKDEE